MLCKFVIDDHDKLVVGVVRLGEIASANQRDAHSVEVVADDLGRRSVGQVGSAGIDLKARCAELFEDLMQSVDVLLSRAVAVGAVRDDVPANEVVGLIVGTCHAAGDSGVSDAGFARMVAVVLDGLRLMSADS